MKHMPPAKRYHRIDGWRGYAIPAFAIVGSSDTGTAPDSPAPTPAVYAELYRFRKEVLKPAGINSRIVTGDSSNVFMLKRWLTVGQSDFDKAAQLAVDWLEAHHSDTRYIHEADLDKLGYKAQETVKED